ncbi:MAG: WG repeat-containing protein [Cyclobacteriaceae bacterium]|nr:WG repeat-containing protein [Cyclobacteriaceae bacterium]
MLQAESYLCAMFYKWIIFACLLPIGLLGQTIKGVQMYHENKLWGLENTKPITPAVYDTLIKVGERNLFIAKKHGKGFNSTGVITSKGKIIIPFNYWQVIPSANAFIVSKWEHNLITYGVINQSNNTILHIRYKQISDFSNFWVGQSFSGDLQLFNLKGVFIKQVNADSISISNNTQYLLVHKRGKVGLIGSNGNEIVAPKYKKIYKKEDHWEVEKFAIWQIISSKDTLVLQADTVKTWNKEHLIVGINNNFYLTKNTELLSKSYRSIDAVSPTLAIVKSELVSGSITIKGEEVIAPSFRQMYYAKGYFYTKKNNKWAVYDSLGKKRSVFNYDSIGSIANGLFPIKRNGKWGFMNREGKEVIHCIYDIEANFSKGKAIIQYFGSTGIIDLNGHWVVKPKAEKITDYSSNFYIFKKGNLYYLKNYDNELIYFASNKLVFKNELIYQIKDGYTNRVTSLGTLVANTRTVIEGSQSWQIIKIGAKYGFEDPQGVLKIAYRYDSLLPFSEGLAGFKLRGKWGYINEDEIIQIQPLYDEVTQFENGVALVSQNGHKGLVKSNGTFILKPKFNQLSLIESNLWLVKKNGLVGVYDTSGKVIIQPKFDRINYVNSDLIIVIRNGKFGVVDSTGKSVIPRIYDYIGFDTILKLLILKQAI